MTNGMRKEFLQDADAARKALSTIPTEWDGKTCVLHLKEAAFNWRQMEWIGFYFEMICRQVLPSGNFKVPGETIGRITFDAKRSANWDAKSHAVKTNTHVTVLNDKLAMDESVRRYGWHGLIVAIVDCEYNDTDRAFQKWHTELKGGLSAYENARIKRTSVSRYRKTRALLSEILFIGIDAPLLDRLHTHRQGRNSNGNPRAPKYAIDLEDLDDFPVIRWPDKGTLNPGAAPSIEPSADE